MQQIIGLVFVSGEQSVYRRQECLVSAQAVVNRFKLWLSHHPATCWVAQSGGVYAGWSGQGSRHLREKGRPAKGVPCVGYLSHLSTKVVSSSLSILMMQPA